MLRLVLLVVCLIIAFPFMRRFGVVRTLLGMTFLLTVSGLVYWLAKAPSPCEELAERVCKRAGDKLATCAGVPSSDKKTDKSEADCGRLETFSASCDSLLEKAKVASNEDTVACKADLELIRALERQQM